MNQAQTSNARGVNAVATKSQDLTSIQILRESLKNIVIANKNLIAERDAKDAIIKKCEMEIKRRGEILKKYEIELKNKDIEIKKRDEIINNHVKTIDELKQSVNNEEDIQEMIKIASGAVDIPTVSKVSNWSQSVGRSDVKKNVNNNVNLSSHIYRGPWEDCRVDETSTPTSKPAPKPITKLAPTPKVSVVRDKCGVSEKEMGIKKRKDGEECFHGSGCSIFNCSFHHPSGRNLLCDGSCKKKMSRVRCTYIHDYESS